MLTTNEQLDLLSEYLNDSWAASEKLDKILFEKWRDERLVEKQRHSIFSFTREEFLTWAKKTDLNNLASSEAGFTDGLYAVATGNTYQVYQQERGMKHMLASEVSLDDAKIAVLLDILNMRTGDYLAKLFNR